MNIFLLEDNFPQREKLEKIIREVLTQNKWIPENLISTGNPDKLLKWVSEYPGLNTYFLDIEINENAKKGLEIARQIRTLDKFSTIAFITTHSNFALITYQYRVSAFDFIDKSNSIESLKQHIRACLAVHFEDNKVLENKNILRFENKHVNFMVHISDVLFFETLEISHKIQLVKRNLQIIRFYGNLSEIPSKHPYLFQCHRSYVINLQHVESIDRSTNTVIFENGETCFISRRKIKEALNQIKKLSEIQL